MAQDNSSTGNTGGPPSRVEEIIEKGLEKYGEGDLLGALNEWEHALQIAAPAPSARIEYTDYVRENFDVLSEKFSEARAVARNANDQGVPITESANDPDAYDSMELRAARRSRARTAGGSTTASAAAAATRRVLGR